MGKGLLTERVAELPPNATPIAAWWPDGEIGNQVMLMDQAGRIRVFDTRPGAASQRRPPSNMVYVQVFEPIRIDANGEHISCDPGIYRLSTIPRNMQPQSPQRDPKADIRQTAKSLGEDLGWWRFKGNEQEVAGTLSLAQEFAASLDRADAKDFGKVFRKAADESAREHSQSFAQFDHIARMHGAPTIGRMAGGVSRGRRLWSAGFFLIGIGQGIAGLAGGNVGSALFALSLFWLPAAGLIRAGRGVTLILVVTLLVGLAIATA